ncbi:MAG: hypothetical protein EXQ85_06265 [Alphaproteobacteria bacterium]|nr:hypothetical protein [Alphaproteobacteria bacterium]
MRTTPDLLPATSHDEASRQGFLRELRVTVTGPMSEGNRVVFDGRARRRYEKTTGRTPTDRHAVRRAMRDDPYHQAWSSLMRSTQEMLFDEVGMWADRHRPELARAANAQPRRGGSLRLDPAVTRPAYLSAVDVHCMPGGCLGERDASDLTTGLGDDRAVLL